MAADRTRRTDETCGPGTGRRGGRLTKLALSAAGLLLGLLVVECSLALLGLPRGRPEGRYWGHWLDDDQQLREAQYNRDYAYHEAVGYVRPDLLDPRPSARARRLRILVLGDSIAHVTTFVAALDHEVQQRFPERQVELINAGTAGYDTTLERRFLEHVGLRYEPDLVLLQFCLNDFYPTPLIMPRPGGGWLAYDGGRLGPWLSPRLMRWSRLYRLLVYALLRHPGHEPAEAAERRVRRELAALTRVAEAHGIPLRLVLFPQLTPGIPDQPSMVRLRAIVAGLQLSSRTLDLTAALRAADPARVLRGGDAIHPGPHAARTAARATFSFLQRELTRLLRGKPLALRPSARAYQIVGAQRTSGLLLQGFSRTEQRDRERWRWAHGPQAAVSVIVPREGLQLSVEYDLTSPIVGQQVRVSLDDAQATHLGPLGGWQRVAGTLRFAAHRGWNTVRWAFDRWGSAQHPFALPDRRPLAARFRSLRVRVGPAAAR